MAAYPIQDMFDEMWQAAVRLGRRAQAALATASALEVLTVLVVVGYLAMVAVTAATAPPLETDPGDTAEREGEVVISNQGPFRKAKGYVTVVGPNGSVRWQSPEAWAHFDAQRLPNGNILAAFMVRDRTDCGPYDSPCARTGFRVYDPDRPDPIVREWTYPVRSHINSEVHDVERLPNGNIVVAGMDRERVFVVNDAGDIVWQWNASRVYDEPAFPTKTDWLHINDVDYLGDGRFMVSVRNANQVLVIDRQKEVLEVVNADSDPSVIREQHNPMYLGPGRILVADSGNDRVVELRKNGSGEWVVAWQLRSAGGVALHWPRDVDRLENGNLLVTDSFNGRVFEVTRNGTLVWSRSTEPIPYEADYNGTEYPTGVANGSDPGQGETEPGPDPDADPEGSLPLFGPAYAAFVGTVSVPYWFDAGLFLGLVVTTVVALVGVLDSLRRRV